MPYSSIRPRTSCASNMNKLEKDAARGIEKDLKLIVRRGIVAARKGDVLGRMGVGIEVSSMLKQLHLVYWAK